MAEQLNNGPVPFEMEPSDIQSKIIRSKVITKQAFKDDGYELDDLYVENANPDVNTVRTTADLIKLAEAGKVEIDARVIETNAAGGRRVVQMETKKFLEAYRKENSKPNLKFKEGDPFLTDGEGSGGQGIGQDYIPLLGGPFNKQLYIYDYLKMHATAFHAYHHDPIARRIVNLKRDFTLGRGFQVTCKDPMGMALWNAFEEANDLYNLMDYVAKEMEIYGETMLWFLPNNQTKIGFQLSGNQRIPIGTIPRVRIIDPSVIWEIVTYPEDITRVLYYQWVAPTQYQIYQGRDQGGSVPSSKFIYQQIPGDQVDHWKINCVSNEKRGRSGLFPVLGYLKRLRDTVNYAIVAMQKQAAWSIDTEIDGNQQDIDSYVDSQNALGSIAPAGSEFVHSTKVKRTYGSNAHTSSGKNDAFDWCLSMIATGTGIPISYLNTHLAAGATKASALVGTEPVTKMFEKTQLVYEQILLKFARRLFDAFGLEGAQIEVTFPELVTQDRSAKLQDLSLAQTMGWVSSKRAAEIAAQELQITEYDFDKEQEAIEDEDAMKAQKSAPLTAPGAAQGGDPNAEEPPKNLGAEQPANDPAISGTPGQVDNEAPDASRSSISADGKAQTAKDGTTL